MIWARWSAWRVMKHLWIRQLRTGYRSVGLQAYTRQADQRAHIIPCLLWLCRPFAVHLHLFDPPGCSATADFLFLLLSLHVFFCVVAVISGDTKNVLHMKADRSSVICAANCRPT